MKRKKRKKTNWWLICGVVLVLVLVLLLAKPLVVNELDGLFDCKFPGALPAVLE